MRLGSKSFHCCCEQNAMPFRNVTEVTNKFMNKKVKSNDDIQDLVSSSVGNTVCTVGEELCLLHKHALILIQQAMVYIRYKTLVS